MTISKIVRTPATDQIPEIMSEMKTAADRLLDVGWGVSIFGSARIRPDSPYYALSEALGRRLAKAGFPVIAGGGPGIMEAANKGAFEAGGESVGLNIVLPREASNNAYQTHSLSFEYFYSRKATFFMHSVAYIALPGGFGTLDELFEILTMVQTRKLPPAPIILMGSEHWLGLLDWIKTQLIPNQLISPGDIDLVTVSDDIDEVMTLIERFCAEHAEELDCAPSMP